MTAVIVIMAIDLLIGIRINSGVESEFNNWKEQVQFNTNNGLESRSDQGLLKMDSSSISYSTYEYTPLSISINVTIDHSVN